jgi:hypothetical protein
MTPIDWNTAPLDVQQTARAQSRVPTRDKFHIGYSHFNIIESIELREPNSGGT